MHKNVNYTNLVILAALRNSLSVPEIYRATRGIVHTMNIRMALQRMEAAGLVRSTETYPREWHRTRAGAKRVVAQQGFLQRVIEGRA